MKPVWLRRIEVVRRPKSGSFGWLVLAGHPLPASLGRSGIRADKREGDGATPRGTFRLTRVWYRPDRGARPRTGLPIRRIHPDDGWCDDPSSAAYNRPVRLPCRGGHEKMWRGDALYDYVVELAHNTRPRVRGRGSAIFMHVATPDFGPTAGCIALRGAALKRMLARIGPKTRIRIR